jgi:hypothetical protein
MGAQGRGTFAGLHGQQCYVMQPLTVVLCSSLHEWVWTTAMFCNMQQYMVLNSTP